MEEEGRRGKEMPNVMNVCNPASGRTEAPIASPARSPDTCFPASSIRLSPAFLIPLSDSETLMWMPGSSLRSQLRPSEPPTPRWIRWPSDISLNQLWRRLIASQ